MATPPATRRQSFPALQTCGKKVFPFRLACPSFVYPAGYVDNVRHLAPIVDEVELLCFESRFADSLPTPALVRELAHMAQAFDVTYNVHLPTDIYLGHADAGVRQTAVDVLQQFIGRTSALAPTTYTLHLMQSEPETDTRSWQARTVQSLEALLETGVTGRCISVENLDYDFALAAPIVEQLDLSVCMDMGHLMAHEADLGAFYTNWRERITMIHLHGVDGTRDHLPLDRLAPAHRDAVMHILKQYAFTVSLEVFAFEALKASLNYLAELWRKQKAERG